ncbi:MAG: metallophosphoesterase [Bryobacteraceae bacterium]
MSFRLILTIVFALFAASQIYWYRRVRFVVLNAVPSRRGRITAGVVGLAIYLVLLGLNFGWFGQRATSTRTSLYGVLVEAPVTWWIASSLVAFLVASILWLLRQAARPFLLLRKRVSGVASEPVDSGRRVFLERAAGTAIAMPFVAGAYGLLYGRLNLETTQKRIRLTKLPKAFEGFRIAQLSDIHIGPFMPEDSIRKYVEITNGLKPDLIALTGDFITWDPATQKAVVSALSKLKAPFGVFGCLGNHEAWSGTEDSITLLFHEAGIPILRKARMPIQTKGEILNLIGVDYESRRRMGPSTKDGYVPELLTGVDRLMLPDTANILMSHNPDTFDRAAELGIDLSLAGHTHGGQVALEFISPEIAPSRLVTPYVSGWFEKPGGQLYVNRGIGTIGVPMRIGAPPEITVYQLVREA